MMTKGVSWLTINATDIAVAILVPSKYEALSYFSYSRTQIGYTLYNLWRPPVLQTSGVIIWLRGAAGGMC